VKAVVQVALGFFSFTGLQIGLTAFGLAILIPAALVMMARADPSATIGVATAVGLPGAFLVVVIPLWAGGTALRYASTPTLLHLRPFGRLRLLLGATLAITLVAMVVTVALPTTYYFLAFFGMWGYTAGAWLVVFFASSWRLLYMVVPPAVVFAAIFLKPWLTSGATDPLAFFAVMLAAWLAFAVWYGRARKISRPTWFDDRSPIGFGDFTFGGQERVAVTAVAPSRSLALRAHLLGWVSKFQAMAAGAIPAVLILGMTLVTPAQEDLLSFLLILTMFQGSVGYMVARRARRIWLRSGHDRASLFRLTERITLPRSLLAYGTAAAILLLASLPGRQDEAPVLILYAVAVTVLAAGVFYFGLSLTRGWSGIDGVIVFVLFVLCMPVNNSINTDQAHSIESHWIWIEAAMFGVMALLLRWHALRRWRALDWRVALLPTAGRSTP
jgi:hypothetical protein